MGTPSTEAPPPLTEAAVREIIREEVAAAVAAALPKPSGEPHAIINTSSSNIAVLNRSHSYGSGVRPGGLLPRKAANSAGGTCM